MTQNTVTLLNGILSVIPATISAYAAIKAVKIANQAASDQRKSQFQSEVNSAKPLLNLGSDCEAATLPSGEVRFKCGTITNIGRGPALHVKVQAVVNDRKIPTSKTYLGTLTIGQSINTWDASIKVTFDLGKELQDAIGETVEAAFQFEYSDLDGRRYLATYPYWISKSEEDQNEYDIDILQYTVVLILNSETT